MFGKNLVHLRKSHNLTQSVLAGKLRIARTTLGDYERGKTEPNFAMLSQLSDLFGVDIDTLITAPLYKDGSIVKDPGSGRIKRFIDPQTGFLQSIDLVETKAEAGYLDSFQDPEYIQDLPKLYLPHLPKNEYRGFEIEGESMLPMKSGTIIIGVKVESLESLRNQHTYIIITKRDGMVFKRIRKHPSKDYLTAVSDNPVYPPYQIEYNAIAEIWQHYAHISFSDRSAGKDTSLEDRIKDIQQKVNEMYQSQGA